MALSMWAEREITENLTKTVKRMISGSIDKVADKAFFIACFNILCCTDKEEYVPNEVGIVKYSIRRGIEEYYHNFIDTGIIPLGYTYVCKQLSEDTHKIPISRFELAEKNYNKIGKDILKLVNPMPDTVVPLFCAESSIKQNRSCLKWLSDRVAQLRLEDTLHFYDLTCLLMELRAYVGQPFPTNAAAFEFLSSHAFDYAANTRCVYHEENDNRFCALGCAKRACFMLSDALCSLYSIKCTPNHMPQREGEVQIQQLPSYFTIKGIPSRTFIPPKLPQQYSICNTAINNTENNMHSNTDYVHSWMKEFCQPQLDIASSNKNNSGIRNSDRQGEMRQPFTNPLVLNALPINPKFSCGGRGMRGNIHSHTTESGKNLPT